MNTRQATTSRPRSRGLYHHPHPGHVDRLDPARLPRPTSLDPRRREQVIATLRAVANSRRHTIGHVSVYLRGEAPVLVESIQLGEVLGTGSQVKLARLLELVEAGVIDGRVPFCSGSPGKVASS